MATLVLESSALAEMDVQALAARVRDLRLRQDMSRERLAQRAGVSASYIKKLEEAAMDRPSDRMLDAVAAALGFHSRRPLLDGEDPPSIRDTNVAGRVEDLRAAGAVPLPVYRWGSCGDPRDTFSAPDPDHLEHPPVGRESLVGPRGFGVIVRGESMAARGIHDGDVVWVNPDRGTRIGGVVLADCRSKDGTNFGMVVKVLAEEQIGMQGRGQVLKSAGERDRYTVDCDEFTVIGPVVWITSGRPPS